jgi:hypothetical protein
MFKYLFALALVVIHQVAAFTVVVPACRAASRLFAEYEKMEGESKINLKVRKILFLYIVKCSYCSHESVILTYLMNTAVIQLMLCFTQILTPSSCQLLQMVCSTTTKDRFGLPQGCGKFIFLSLLT